jgi:hypothetical protein
VAQGEGPWFDPPASVSRAGAASSTRRLRSADEDRPQAARSLAISYLDAWSASNRAALQATPRFYGTGAVFHGRRMSAADLVEEKRRFAERWPVRRYHYRRGTMRVACEPDGTLCTVRSLFDFTASNASLGRRSRGVGHHEIVVSFLGDRPVIASENSGVLERTLRR